MKHLFVCAILLSLSQLTGFAFQQSQKPSADTCRIVFGWKESDEGTPLLDWIKKGGYTWGLELLHDIPAQRISELHSQGWNIVLYQLSHPETVVRYYNQKKRAIPDIDSALKKYISATDGKLFWQNILEDESCGVGLSQEFLSLEPGTHEEAYQMTTDYFRKSVSATTAYGNLPHWSVAGFANTAHILAKQPEIDLLTIERANDDVDDLQTGIAFFRGAAKQYNKMWGVDLSLWWGCVYGCIQNMPYLYHKRHLYVSWYSGAEHFRIEGSELFFDKSTNKPNIVTECLDQFGAFIKSHERGEQEVPVAVLLPKDHGWITPPYWRTTNTVWNYAHIPYRQGQKALDGFFSTAYPGSNFYMDPFSFGKYKTENPPASPFALSFISPEFAPDSADVFRAEYPVPFGLFENRKVAGKEMEEKQIETSEFRPMGNSRWGDIFDVLTTEAESDIISKYKVIIVLDQAKLDEVLIEKLNTAMNSGATVICAAGVLKPEHSGLIGGVMKPVIAVGSAWSAPGEAIIHEPFRFIPATLTDGKAIVSASDGSPIVIEKKHGAGRLISCMIPWFEGATTGISNAALYLFDMIISEVQPVMVEGPPVEYLSSRNESEYTVLISNNSSLPWKGKVTARNITKEYGKCMELLTGEPLRYKLVKNEGALVELVVPAFDVRAVCWSKQK